jgi:hypothetical protein
MVKVVLAFNGQQHEIFLDTDEPVEVFRYQIYSVTDVPPERQWISGLGVGYLSNQTQLGSLNIVDGQRVSLIDSVTAPVAPAAAPPGNPMADMMQNLMRMMQPVADWQHVCTRVFLGAELPSAQPRYRYRGIIVCHACATTCCQHDQVAPAADDTAFVCQCCTLNGHECVFEVRAAIGEDILNGNASLTLCSQLAAAGIIFHFSHFSWNQNLIFTLVVRCSTRRSRRCRDGAAHQIARRFRDAIRRPAVAG